MQSCTCQIMVSPMLSLNMYHHFSFFPPHSHAVSFSNIFESSGMCLVFTNQSPSTRSILPCFHFSYLPLHFSQNRQNRLLNPFFPKKSNETKRLILSFFHQYFYINIHQQISIFFSCYNFLWHFHVTINKKMSSRISPAALLKREFHNETILLTIFLY